MSKEKILNLVYKNKVLVENFAYMALLQVFIMAYPLITYPYLVEVLGREIYGVFLTAQVLVSYVSLFVDFGSNFVCTKHISLNRDNPLKLASILSNVLAVRFVIFVILFLVYSLIILIVPQYSKYKVIYLLTFGFVTNELFFPQFFFQGLEKMKLISIINVITKIILLPFIFILVKNANDVYMVPIIYSFGFFIGGLISLYYIRFILKLKFVRPSLKESIYYIKDCSSVFATDLICTVKDKFNYFFVGSMLGMSEVVIYDLGVKLYTLAAKPYIIICTVLFPRLAKSRNLNHVKNTVLFTFLITLIVIVLANLFLNEIVLFFLNEQIDLFPIRLFLFAPLILSVSYVISNNFFVAFGYNKYLFYSIVFTTIVYVMLLISCYFFNFLNNVTIFVMISIVSFSVELIYRLFLVRKICKNK